MPSVGGTHHVELGGHFYLIKPGSYQKRTAPQFGARFTTGDPDFNNLSMWQHWAQRCWVGGMDAPDWADDAMYDRGVGINSTEHEQLTMGRGMARGGGSNWALSSAGVNGSQGHKTIVYNRTLYVATMSTVGNVSHLYRYDPTTDGWVRVTSLDAQGLVIRSVATFDGRLFLGGFSTGGVSKVVFSSGALSAWTAVTNPAGMDALGVYAMKSFQQRLYVAYNTNIWRLKTDNTWDGSTVFYKADQNSDSNSIAAFEVHLGFLYGLSQNGHIHRTDGNTTFDIWNWDGGVQGVSIKSFDGRLFIITFEYTNTADVGFGVLYQMSGSAVTELKRWGKDTESNIIGSLAVYSRRLWYGASNLLGTRAGFGIACYDPVEDGHSIWASNTDTVTYARGAAPYTNYIVDDVTFFEGRAFAFVRGHGAFTTPFIPHDVELARARFDITAAGGAPAAQAGGWIASSAYDAGTPGVRKLWRKISIDCTIPTTATSIIVEYSTDNGATYTALTAITAVGTRQRKEFWLDNIVSVSLKLRITLRSTSVSETPILYGYIVSYLPVPEPNWMWTFTIVLSEYQALLDGTNAAVDTEAELGFLRDTYRAKQLVDFVDVDGTTWASGGPGALIYDITFHLRDLGQPLEGEVQITLVEAVETY